MSDENDLRYYEDDPLMPEPVRYIFQLIKQQAARSEVFEAETQRKFDFLVEQQAQLTATVEKMAEKVDRTANSITDLLAAAVLQAEEIKTIGHSVDALAAAVKAVDERQREADERARRTDERLDALINTVERVISERQNGKGGTPE
jgi:methyl-accepting chemotaxis protein